MNVSNVRALRPALRSVGPDPIPAAPTLDDVYRRDCRYVGAVILRISGRRAELEDLIQEVFAEAAASFDRLREPAAVRGWLATIAVRVTRRRLRRRRLFALLGLDAGTDYEEVAGAEASPFDRALVAQVYRALDQLGVDDRVAFVLHHVEGETLDAVAALCGCSRTTAKRRIARARNSVERRLAGG
ncbi:MAG TPA: sigma-70 family RNA polymerase sigma factor [Polyangiaceae bacterium]